MRSASGCSLLPALLTTLIPPCSSNSLSLASLSLKGVLLGDDSIKQLAALTNLKILSLDGTGLTDAGLDVVAGMKDLEQLSVVAVGVTDAGLAKTAISDKAEVPDFDQYKGHRRRRSQTSRGIAQLQEALPNCKIKR